MRDKYAPFLLSTKGKVLVFMATASLLIAGIYGVTKVRLRQYLVRGNNSGGNDKPSASAFVSKHRVVPICQPCFTAVV